MNRRWVRAIRAERWALSQWHWRTSWLRYWKRHPQAPHEPGMKRQTDDEVEAIRQETDP